MVERIKIGHDQHQVACFLHWQKSRPVSIEMCGGVGGDPVEGGGGGGGAHCVPCNTFGEQREIYGWIRLFFKPPWKQKSKICLLHSKTERRIHSKTAIFNRPIQGGLAHHKCYARVQPGHSVPSLKTSNFYFAFNLVWALLYQDKKFHLNFREILYFLGQNNLINVVFV